MNPPNIKWQRVIFSDHILGLLQRNFRSKRSAICSYAENLIQTSHEDIDSEEGMALMIGGFVCDIYPEEFKPILQDDIEGMEGQELAKGFVGALAMRYID